MVFESGFILCSKIIVNDHVSSGVSSFIKCIFEQRFDNFI